MDETKRVCRKCDQLLDVSEFNRSVTYKTYTCNNCSNKYVRDWRKMRAQTCAKEQIQREKEIAKTKRATRDKSLTDEERFLRNEKARQRYKTRKEITGDTVVPRNTRPVEKLSDEEKRRKQHLWQKEYNAANKDKINETRRKYVKTLMANNPRERVKRSLKTLLLAKISKNNPSTTYLGTSMQLILAWLQFNFRGDIDWNNYGAYWHIDHVIPIDLWNLDDEAEKMLCFNWKNLMPLEKHANMKKGALCQPPSIFYQEQRLRLFFKENDISENLDEYLNSYSKKFKDLLPEFYMRHTSIAGSPL